MDKRMTIAEAIEHMGLSKTSVKTYLAKQLDIRASEVNLTHEINLSEMMELAERFPEHRKRVIITIDPGNENPRAEIVGDWKASDIQMANRAYHGVFGRLKRALRLGSDQLAVRNKPTAEELREAKARDFEMYGGGLTNIEN